MRAPSSHGGAGLPSVAAAVAVFGALGGCVIETEVGSDVPERARVASVPSSFKHDLDLLFVVDDRAELASIRSETTALWRRVRGNLAYAEGGFPSVRIGVVSSDLGVGGAKVGACTPYGGDAALRVHDGLPWLYVDPTNLDASDIDLGARLTLADAGCPYDQPIGALERALDGSQPLNDGFLRDGSALGIIIVGGDDDCSVDDPAFWAPDVSGAPVDPFRCFREAVHCSGDDVYSGVQHGCIPRQAPPHLVDAGMTAAFLRGLRPDADSVVVTGIMGDKDQVAIVENGGDLSLDSACEDPERPLLPGVRLAGFVRDMGGTTAGVCKAPVESAGAATGLELRDALGHRCLEGDIADVDLGAPGMQVDCVVTALEPSGIQRELAACPNPNNVIDAAGPCWAIKDGAGQCGDFPSGLSLQVNWGGNEPMTQPDGVTALVSCVVDAPSPP